MILVLLILIFVMLNVKYACKLNDNIEILQLNNPHKDILEENMQEMSPTIITNAIDKNMEQDRYSLNNLNLLGKKIQKNVCLIKTTFIELKSSSNNSNNNNKKIYSEKKELISTPFNKYFEWLLTHSDLKENNTDPNFYLNESVEALKYLDLDSDFDEFAKYYSQPFSIFNKYSLSIGNASVKSKIKQVNSKRLINHQFYGSRVYYLFSPSQKKYLYPSTSCEETGELMSDVDFWNQNSVKHPDFNKSQYIEIILNEGNMFYIPKYWWYCFKHVETSVTITQRSDTMTDMLTKTCGLM